MNAQKGKLKFVCGFSTIQFDHLSVDFAHFYFYSLSSFLRPSACVSKHISKHYDHTRVYECSMRIHTKQALYLMHHFKVHGVRFKVKNLKRQCRRRLQQPQKDNNKSNRPQQHH